MKVNNHQDWRSAPDEQHAWLWFHNGVADEYAKAVFSQSDKRVNDCHRRAAQAVKHTRTAQAQVYALHRSVAEVFSTKHHTRKSPPRKIPFKIESARFLLTQGLVFLVKIVSQTGMCSCCARLSRNCYSTGARGIIGFQMNKVFR